MPQTQLTAQTASKAIEPNVINGIWYTDEIVNALIEQCEGEGTFKHTSTEEGGAHTFITPPVSDSDAGNTNIDYFLDIGKQPAPRGIDNRRDVFQHTGLFTRSKEKVRILIPYCAHQHWQLCEVNIEKKKKKFSVVITLHDPKGGGTLEDSLFKRLKQTITNKLNELAPSEIKFTNNTSPYTSRQADNDNDSCGVIMMEDLEKRSINQDLGIGRPFTEQEIHDLRVAHLNKLRHDTRYSKLVRQFSGETIVAFNAAVTALEGLAKTTKPEERRVANDALLESLSKLPAMETSFAGGKLFFYGSTRQPTVMVAQSFFGPSLKITCGMGEYIVEVDRVNKHGALLPNCKDILHYKDGKLQTATCTGSLEELSESRSRVESLLQQSKFVNSVKVQKPDLAGRPQPHKPLSLLERVTRIVPNPLARLSS